MTSPPDLLARMRALPAAAPLLPLLADDPTVHVVGGAVRDLLLGGAPLDLDLVVEGDAVALAQRLAIALVGELTVHERFGTACVTAGGHAYDFATARAESYPQPGALPHVREATLAEDLLRRDFTVNAIALALDGTLTAAPGALEDLDGHVLRVLHDASFRDDPTRLLRLVRYATRLGFAVEPETDRLAREALAAGALATVTPSRIGGELRLVLREPSALDALAWIAGWGDALGIALDVDRALVERARALLPPDGRDDLLLLAAALRGGARGALEIWLASADFPGLDRDIVVAAALRAPRAAALLAQAERPSQIAGALAGEPTELVALAGALGPEEPARRWLEQLREIRPAIDGQDLIAAGIPQGEAIGRGLLAAYRAALDGEAPDHATQLEVALAAARP